MIIRVYPISISHYSIPLQQRCCLFPQHQDIKSTVSAGVRWTMDDATILSRFLCDKKKTSEAITCQGNMIRSCFRLRKKWCQVTIRKVSSKCGTFNWNDGISSTSTSSTHTFYPPEGRRKDSTRRMCSSNSTVALCQKYCLHQWKIRQNDYFYHNRCGKISKFYAELLERSAS